MFRLSFVLCLVLGHRWRANFVPYDPYAVVVGSGTPYLEIRHCGRCGYLHRRMNPNPVILSIYFTSRPSPNN